MCRDVKSVLLIRMSNCVGGVADKKYVYSAHVSPTYNPTSEINHHNIDDVAAKTESHNAHNNAHSVSGNYGKSFRHFTREALPRLDNYRNMMSIQAAYRPTLDELHNITVQRKVIFSFTNFPFVCYANLPKLRS